ncbi:MAG: cytochrome P450, partial [Acaryochloridaceae cyanobacterium CSU_5_19]|nr:cytochrome P450 [Acaryochloridaceae cyanobacterium CSU_5_19]
SGYPFTDDRQLIVTIQDLFFAGSETTSTTLKWALMFLSLHQQVQELSSRSIKRIGIQPYFLFSGSIMDAILLEIDQLKCNFNHLNFYYHRLCSPPLTSPICSKP